MSREFWYDFIQLYKSFPCLWDLKDPLYAQREIRKEAYDVLLAKVLEIDSTATLDTVKKKIDCFRSTFRREEKKVLMSMQSRDGDVVYTPKLWYYRDLEEILGHNVDEVKKQSVSNESFHSEDDTLFVQRIESSEESDYNYETLPKKRKTIPKQLEIPRVFTQRFPQRKPEVKDDCSTFAAHLEMQMRDVCEEQKYIAQKLISDVMFLARTNRLNYNSSVNSNHPEENDSSTAGPVLKPCKNEDSISTTNI